MLSLDEKEAIARLMSKMDEDSGDHAWVASSGFAAMTSKGKTDYITSAINAFWVWSRFSA